MYFKNLYMFRDLLLPVKTFGETVSLLMTHHDLLVFMTH